MRAWAAASVFSLTLLLGVFPRAAAGTLSEVVFTETSPLSGDAELARRMTSPLAVAHNSELQARAKSGQNAQPVNPSQEKFAIYVPSQKPAGGYRLLVFVPPWNDARLPDGWADVFDQYGVIFVSALMSGNDQNVIGRRVPLALIAEQNVTRRYAVDTSHIFVGGFSGGARVASRVALGYPDVFSGAFLDAGSDEIGTRDLPLPPRELFDRFQAQSHVVFVTGDRDLPPLEEAVVTQKSMRQWCAFNIDRVRIPQGFHSAAGPSALSHGLDLLMHPVKPDIDRLTECRSGIDAELSEGLQRVRSLIDAGKRDAARQELNGIDERFGGLAAPRSLALDEELGQVVK